MAMAEYQGHLYALTRNQVQACEVWRTNSSGGWEQVLFPNGVTNGVYNNIWINNVWARMIVFNGKLYFGFSAGLQGNYLGSSGSEIWRYDGVTWEPIISDKNPVDAARIWNAQRYFKLCVRLTGARLLLSRTARKVMGNNQSVGWWRVAITSGNGKYRKFRIISNTANSPYDSAERDCRHL